MCGRYAITATPELVGETFEALWELEPAQARLPRFNVAPTQSAPVVRIAGGPGRRMVSLLRWGLVPSWADDPSIGQRLINARVETASTKPSFRAAWKRRRCLVPITHFYEWKRDGARKQPMAIAPVESGGGGSLLALGGVWESWRGEMESFTILTTEPNDLLRPIHDRMPLVIPASRWSRWLDPAWSGPEGEAELAEWSAPAPPSVLRVFAVSPLVNSPRHDSPECLAPVGA